MSYVLLPREDDYGPAKHWIIPDPVFTLAEVLRMAEKLDGWIDVMDGDRYLVTSGWYFWPPATTGAEMHQIGSHGWCHDCHKAGLGYVHHLDYETELAVLANEARHDSVLRKQVEADGQTPEQYAAEVAGRAVPLHGDESFAIDVQPISTDLEAGTADFAVQMWDMTTWRVTVPLGEGAPQAASRLAEERAYAAQPKRCHDCKGTRGHAKTCSVTRELEFYVSHPDIAREFFAEHPEHLERNPELAAALAPILKEES